MIDEIMINSSMPVASPWTNMPEVDSPSFLPEHSKNFFDYAEPDEDPSVNDPESFYPIPESVDSKADSAQVPLTSFIVEDFISMDDMEEAFVTADAQLIVSVVGSGEEVLGETSIPSTAMELVIEDGERVQFSQLDGTSAPLVLNANAFSAPSHHPPTPLSCPPPASPSPFSPPGFSSYPHPPSTPSCYSSCSSDDVASSIGEVSTPGVTSGEQFVIPVPADDKMAVATMTALQTCSLTPLIKEELKYTIQSRRLAAGKPELVVDNSPPVRAKKVMTKEERERALKRREQNRMAAQRFRQKQKDTADVLHRKCQRLEGSNNTLKGEIRRLARESQELRQLLTSHLLVCPKVKVAR